MEQETLIERIDNIKQLLINFQNDNKEEHTLLIQQVTQTNGKVKSLQIWKASIVGAVAVIVFVAGYTINDYFKHKDVVREIEKQQAIIMDRINHYQE